MIRKFLEKIIILYCPFCYFQNINNLNKHYLTNIKHFVQKFLPTYLLSWSQTYGTGSVQIFIQHSVCHNLIGCSTDEVT